MKPIFTRKNFLPLHARSLVFLLITLVALPLSAQQALSARLPNFQL